MRWECHQRRRRFDRRDALVALRRRVPERHGLQTRRVHELEDGDVVMVVVADDAGGVGLAVADVGRCDLGRAGDHVVVREDLADELTTIPVPAALPSLSTRTVLMSTRPGSTLPVIELETPGLPAGDPDSASRRSQAC